MDIPPSLAVDDLHPRHVGDYSLPSPVEAGSHEYRQPTWKRQPRIDRDRECSQCSSSVRIASSNVRSAREFGSTPNLDALQHLLSSYRLSRLQVSTPREWTWMIADATIASALASSLAMIQGSLPDLASVVDSPCGPESRRIRQQHPTTKAAPM